MFPTITDGLQFLQNHLQCLKKLLVLNTEEELKTKIQLTERSFHAIGRTRLGMPDQLNFRNSSIKTQWFHEKQETYYQFTYTDMFKLAQRSLQQWSS